jgi:hypothetical protein
MEKNETKASRLAEVINQFTRSTIWIVPTGITSVDVFCVGGGGAGSGDWYLQDHSGSGGNGGVVAYATNVSVTPGASIAITIGTGGIGGTRNQTAQQGGTTSFGTLVTSAGGYGGLDGQPAAQTSYGRGGANGPLTGNSNALAGGDGIGCPFLTTNNRYGAGGAGANTAYENASTSKYALQNIGGNTGGGNGGFGRNNTIDNRGGDAAFYGGGGGGASFSSGHTNSLGGNGFQGIVIIRFYTN